MLETAPRFHSRRTSRLDPPFAGRRLLDSNFEPTEQFEDLFYCASYSHRIFLRLNITDMAQEITHFAQVAFFEFND